MGPRSILYGGRLITSGIKTAPTGTAERISSVSIPCRTLVVISDSGGNAANANSDVTISIGDSEITTAKPGIRPNQGFEFNGLADGTEDPFEYYCISGTASQKLSWWAYG